MTLFFLLFPGPDVGSILGQPAYFEELKSEMAELYGSLAEQVRSRQTVFLPDPVRNYLYGSGSSQQQAKESKKALYFTVL
jgi:hypothetical protein